MTESRWRVVALALAVLLVGAVAGLVLLWGDRGDLADLEDRGSAEAAATRAAEAVVTSWLTYDYRTYDQDIAWVSEDGTASFQEDFAPVDRKELITHSRLVSRGRVVESAATWEKDGQVKVIVFTDQTLTDQKIRRSDGQPLHARSGVELTMVRQGGEWLVDELVQLQFE